MSVRTPSDSSSPTVAPQGRRPSLRSLAVLLSAVLPALLLPFALWAQAMPPAGAVSHRSPYAGQEAREVKALSPEVVQQLLRGEGMGLAKAAELNRYPGPRHVLDLAAELDLSEHQRVATQAIYDDMQARAVALGRALLEQERGLDASFAAGAMEDGELVQRTAEIGRLQGELRHAHLRAHLEMKRILTPQQVDTYNRLRGYNAPDDPGAHRAHGAHGAHGGHGAHGAYGSRRGPGGGAMPGAHSPAH